MDRLAEAGYRTLLMDLRGYGKSDKPRASESHIEYSKREMASDVVQVAQHHGFDKFNLVAHDRGARVAHRLVLDHPDKVFRWMSLDICPTLFMFETTDMNFATKYWHWFFQLLPNAEEIIAGAPEAFFKTATRDFPFAPAARRDYFQAFSSPEGLHGSCEDYRAAATIDLEHDREDREKGNKIAVPKLHVLWGSDGLIETYDDALAVWKSYCHDSVQVTGKSMPTGHYISEQDPEGTLQEILKFVPLK
ncbi:hypothetical protein EMMF5_003854 [Cystobasidiomycetes sp. EMM_F5]